MKTTRIQDIVFPCYSLNSCAETPFVVNGVSSCLTSTHKVKIIDNKNLKGDSLGLRRLRCDPKELLRISICLKDLVGLIKFIKSKPQVNKLFIDISGRIFYYVPTTFTKLIYYPINKSKHDSTHKHTLIYIRNRVSPILLPYTKDIMDYSHVGLIYIPGIGDLYWGLSQEYIEPKRLKV